MSKWTLFTLTVEIFSYKPSLKYDEIYVTLKPDFKKSMDPLYYVHQFHLNWQEMLTNVPRFSVMSMVFQLLCGMKL